MESFTINTDLISESLKKRLDPEGKNRGLAKPIDSSEFEYPFTEDPLSGSINSKAVLEYLKKKEI